MIPMRLAQQTAMYPPGRRTVAAAGSNAEN